MSSWSLGLSLSPSLRRIFLEALILCLLSAAVGLSLNFKLIFNAFSGKSVSAQNSTNTINEKTVTENSATLNGFPIPVELDELDELIAAGALLVDSRNPADFQESHLFGAISLPYAALGDHLANFKKQVSVDQTLVIYCSGYGCTDSFDLGTRLIQAGYGDVLVYEGGFPEWRDAGRPLERAAE
ncbi:MAG: rhodanese-like domain-containing protein [Desulfuromusa sp.]|nr:rhodanese-like domain-containing protein [Desulfuromusa sp.]